MKEIDLTPYETRHGQKVDVKIALANLLFNRDVKLSARDTIKQAALAEKIETAGDSILLEEPEYTRLKNALEAFTGYGRGDLQVINRVLEAPDVAVEKKVPS